MDPRSLPAYPGADYSGIPNNGMTLRDYFAAKTMLQLLAGARLPDEFDATNEIALLGRRAYEVADAMLKAREKT